MLRLRPGQDDEGVTLVELVVSMTLTIVLGAITLALAVTMNDSAAGTTDRSIGASQVRTALQAWGDYLQVADGPSAGSPQHRFEWIAGDSMLFYADLGNRAGTTATTPPTRVWLRRDTNQQLVEEQFAWNGSTSSYPSTPTICRILATSVTSLAFTGYTPSTSSSALGASLAPSGG